MRTTAETMVKLFGRTYCKAGRFFIMERASSRVISTRLFEGYAFINHIDNLNAIEQLLNKTLRYQSVCFS